MKHVKRLWLTLFGVMAIPYAVLFVVGSIWLYERSLLWQFLAASGVLMLGAVPAVQWLRTRGRAQGNRAGGAKPRAEFLDPVRPDPLWPPAAQRAWGEVEAIAQRVERENLPLTRPDALWPVVYEVLDRVARQFRGNSQEPALEIPVPQVLRTAELVARDLRHAFSANVPGSHLLTLGDMKRIRRLARWVQHLYFLSRLLYAGLNPFSAILREVRDAAANRMLLTSTEEVKSWAVGFSVRKAGYYAIQLYSGETALDEEELGKFQSVGGKRDVRQAEADQDRVAAEPLRILLLGQVKSGKSSLVNALFGEARAAVDVVPRTRGVVPYVLEREGLPRAVILDTAGYESGDRAADPFDPFEDQVLQSDLILVVLSATSAARGADRRLLDALRARMLSQPERLMAPVVAVLTHIDLVRPASEWEPPYDLWDASRVKARNIADALGAVAEDLGLATGQAVVPVCSAAGRLYNVEEGLAPAILEALPEAARVKYLRCLRQYHEEQYWRRLWRQTVGAGRVLLARARG